MSRNILSVRIAALRTLSVGAAALFGVCACGATDKTTPHVLQSGEIETWAGTGVQGNNGDGLDREETWFDQPMEMAFAPDGTAVVVDWNNHSIRRVGKDGKVETLIGTRAPGDWPCQQPGVAGECDVPLSGQVLGTALSLNHPMDVAMTDAGSFFIAAWHNHKVEHYDAATKEVTVVAGAQKPGPVKTETGPVSTALFNFPSSVVVQPDGSQLVTDQRNNRVRRITSDGTVTTVVGAAAATATAPAAGTDEDGIPATTALLSLVPKDELDGTDNPPPGGALALDADGNLFIADTFHHCIREISAGSDGVVTGAADELITTVAGTRGTDGYAGDGALATAALLQAPFDIEFSPAHDALYIADTENHVVRRVDLKTGKISTIAGTGKPGFSGDDGPATAAQLREPYGLAFDAPGDLYVVDSSNNRIRRIAH